MVHFLGPTSGFEETGHLVRDHLPVLEYLPPAHHALLTRLGRILHKERNRRLVFKKNAGRYVGNYNYRGAFRITRRADLLIMNGLFRNREEALDIFDYVQRVLAINMCAGKKGIPGEEKQCFPHLNRNLTDFLGSSWRLIQSCARDIASHRKSWISFSTTTSSMVLGSEA